MPTKVNERRLYELYKKILDAQEKKGGIPLTYRELQVAMGFSPKSNAMASRYMPFMALRGYVKEIEITRGRTWLAQKDESGKYVKYNPIDPGQK